MSTDSASSTVQSAGYKTVNKTDGNPPFPLSTYSPAGGEAENKRDKLVEDTISEMVLSTTEKDRAAREGGRRGGCRQGETH